jgi:adenine-specific DNA-methyltransferase
MSVGKYGNAKRAVSASIRGETSSVFQGDCQKLLAALAADTIDLTISSPPYCIGKAYESESTTTADFIKTQKAILPEIVRVTKPGGSICWQTGYHITNGTAFPLDFAIYDILKDIPAIRLRNRIIWSFGHGLNSTTRFSGRHEVVLWFTKGQDYAFNLDSIRVPQKFPIALAQRFIRALCPEDGIVLDPFMGSGSTGVAAEIEKRRFLGAEVYPAYMAVAHERLKNAKLGKIKVRDLDKPILIPSPNSAVAQRPNHFISEV